MSPHGPLDPDQFLEDVLNRIERLEAALGDHDAFGTIGLFSSMALHLWLKAIAGTAHGYLPGRQPLTAKDFSSREATVRKKLEDRGFMFANDEAQPLPSPGDVRASNELQRARES